jgi:hypothetical protein
LFMLILKIITSCARLGMNLISRKHNIERTIPFKNMRVRNSPRSLIIIEVILCLKQYFVCGDYRAVADNRA